MSNKEIFFERGFTDNLKLDLGEKLFSLQSLIYDLTKDLLINHDQNLLISEKIKLPFKIVPKGDSWSKIMEKVNTSRELKEIINSEEVRSAFKKVFTNPIAFEISTFRARFPEQKRVLYNWHQDEGTWHLSKKQTITNKFPATLWFSINGADETNSIQVIKKSHKTKLYDHEWVDGQGYFKIQNIEKKIDIEDIHTANLKESECFIFHPLTVHRSVPTSNNLDLKPRYSLDIRYYDQNASIKINTDIKIYLKRLLKKFI